MFRIPPPLAAKKKKQLTTSSAYSVGIGAVGRPEILRILAILEKPCTNWIKCGAPGSFFMPDYPK